MSLGYIVTFCSSAELEPSLRQSTDQTHCPTKVSLDCDIFAKCQKTSQESCALSLFEYFQE